MAQWSVEARHVIGARHITTHYDVRCDGQLFGRLPVGEELRALLRALAATLPQEERRAIARDFGDGGTGR